MSAPPNTLLCGLHYQKSTSSIVRQIKSTWVSLGNAIPYAVVTYLN